MHDVFRISRKLQQHAYAETRFIEMQLFFVHRIKLFPFVSHGMETVCDALVLFLFYIVHTYDCGVCYSSQISQN